MNHVPFRLAGMTILSILLSTPQGLTEDTLTAIAIDDEGQVGIGVQAPQHQLDVDGNVNAAGFTINGTAILESPWAPSGNNISYTTGNVGIGKTASGSHALDVEGDINASGLQINGTSILESPWTPSGRDISYTNGNVGIGKTASATYILDVHGYVNASGFKVGGRDIAQSPWTPSGNTISYTKGGVGIGAAPRSATLQIGELPAGKDFGGSILGIVQPSYSKVGISVRSFGNRMPIIQICNDFPTTCGYIWISKKGTSLCYQKGYPESGKYGEKDGCGEGTELNFQLTAEMTEKIDSYTEEIEHLKKRLKALEKKLLQ